MTTLPRGLRNNNPGNLERNPSNKWDGELQSDAEPRFCVFSSMMYGCRALIKTLRTYHERRGCETVEDIIIRFAPPSENTTDKYAQFVAKELGVYVDEHLDFTTGTYIGLAKAIARYENGKAAQSIGAETWKKAAVEAGV